MQMIDNDHRARGRAQGRPFGLPRLQDMRFRLHGERPRPRRQPAGASRAAVSRRRDRARRTTLSATARAATAALPPAPGRCACLRSSWRCGRHWASLRPSRGRSRRPWPTWAGCTSRMYSCGPCAFSITEGYIKHLTRWTGYMSFHLPHRVKRR